MTGNNSADIRLQKMIKLARSYIHEIGPMHALWDVIFDAEAILAGKPSILSREVIEQILEDFCKGKHLS